LEGANLEEINSNFDINIDRYLFNPSLFKKNDAKDYLNYSKKILKLCSNEFVSLEVFTGGEENMIRQR